MLKRLIASVLAVVVVGATSSVLADHHLAAKPSVDALAWMTGSWAGPAGPGTLEENWIKPKEGSMASLVRMTANGVTSMVELIVIEPEGDTLVLHVQQWDQGYKPRAGGAQKMTLTNLGENTVSFEAVGEGGMQSLTYTRDGDSFTVSVGTAGGNFDIPLKAQ